MIALSDLMHIPQLAITWGFFFIAGISTFLLSIRKNKQPFSPTALFRHIFPFDFRSAKSVHMDVIIYVIRKLTDFAPGFVAVALTAFISKATFDALKLINQDYVPMHPGYIATFACGVALLLASEFSDYLVHYLEHKNPILWEIHKVHHSAEHLTPITSLRGHSLGLFYHNAVQSFFCGPIAALFMHVYGLSLADTLVLGTISRKAFSIGTLDALKHSHFPISLGVCEGVLISPHMHQIHHSKLKQHWDKNFGTNLSIFDWIFGTAYKPKKNEEIVLGLHGYDDVAIKKYHTLQGAYVAPLVNICRLVAESWRRRRNPALADLQPLAQDPAPPASAPSPR